MKYVSLLLLIVFCSCSTQEQNASLNKNSYEIKGGTVKEELFNLNIGGQDIDEYHRLNPKSFILTDLTEDSGDEALIKSDKTGKVFKAVFKKGDIISIPLGS